ncbi:MAG: peptide-methionine (S)-S-oxide reductase MsrA [Bacteroidota bacterium]
MRTFKFIMLLASLVFATGACAQTKDNKTESTKTKSMEGLEIATLGGGCFWCVEAVYQRIEGIEKVVSGYAGGSVKNPTYKQVTTGSTGHAEVVQVYFDPKVISYEEVLDIFWHSHDPTTLNRQGNDVGTQYRSIILYHNDAQKAAAEKSIKETDNSDLWNDPIVTTVEPLTDFYAAEDYHQNYYNLNKNSNPYCTFVISPKVQKIKKKYADRLKTAEQE